MIAISPRAKILGLALLIGLALIILLSNARVDTVYNIKYVIVAPA